jgi:O-antigen ligase
MIISSLLDRITQALALVLAITTPTLAFYVPGWSSFVLYALVLLSAISFTASRGKMRACATPVTYWWPLLLAALLFVVATLIAQAIHGRWHSSSFEKSLRIVCLLPTLYLFSKLSIEHLKHIQWGFIAATWAGAWALIFPKVTSVSGPSGAARPDTLAYTLYNTIGFANMMMLFASFTVASLFWQPTRFRKLEIALKVTTAGIGYYAMLLSQTRTSLLAVPVFLLVVLLVNPRLSRRAVLAFVGSIIVILTVLSTSSIVRERTGEAYREAVQCSQYPITDTSICIRFQLLRAASTLFQENPWFGVGDGMRFKQNMQALAARGVISPGVAERWGETHNDISYVAATYGIIGLVPFLWVLFGLPAFYLVGHVRRGSEACCRTAAAMGLLLVLGFLSFGMTEMMFRTMRTLSFYVLFVALFLALSGPRGALPQRTDDPKAA